MGNKLIKSDIKLTIGMLVSNHIQYIRNAMEALKPLLEAIPSELIVVDTKGAETDGSIDVVREYTDKIYPFTWCNDFSAARNVCMEHARGEWFLYVDDDEWFDDVTEFIEFFKSGECENYQSGFYYTKDYDADGNYSMGVAGRMIRRRENTCFVGKVHESFNEVYPPRKRFSCFTHHYGYAFRDLEAAKKHRERNVSILKQELLERGGLPGICAQMVQELIYLEDTAEAGFKFAMDALKRNNNEAWLKDSCAQWILVATVRYFVRKKDNAKAKEQYEFIIKNYPVNDMSYMALHGLMANIALEENDAEAMFLHAKKYMKLLDWKQVHEEEAMIQMNLDVPKYGEQEYAIRVLKIGAVAANQLQRREDLQFFLDRLPESEKHATPVEEKEDSLIGGNVKSFQISGVIEKNGTNYPKLIKSDIKLTIGMLVSNHIEYIRKAMDSLKPLLDAVPSELVVLDTMGEKSDGSIAIVKEYTDKVYPFTWCNDFSAARNALLDHAKGEWFLYMDDDEWFDNVQEFIDFFKNGECEEYYAGFYYTRDYLPSGKYSVGIAGRMIRRTETTRFVGKVHETFNEVYAPNKRFSCFTHHYGYAYVNEEERAKKQQRNVSILRAEIEEQGLNPQRAAQMAQELISRDATLEEGYQFCLDSIATLEKKNELKNSCSQWLLVASARCFAGKDNKKVLEQAEYVRANYELTQVGAMALAATVVTVAAAEENTELVKKNCDVYLENWDWKKEHEDEALMQTNLDFPRFMTIEQYYNIVHMRAISANYEGDYVLANQYWKRMPWGAEGFDGSKYAVDLNNTIQGLKRLQEQQKQAAKIKELLPLLNSLQEASDYLKGFVESGQIGEQQELLAGMQEVAITLGTSLDQVLGEGSEEVTLLEKYCELVWECSNKEVKEDKLAVISAMELAVVEVEDRMSGRTK